MKLKKLIFSFLLVFLSSENLLAKALPPGTGIGDVPANVLILLDKSGSMGWRMSGGTASMRYPYDADADSSGNIIVSQYNRDGVKKFLYDTASTDSGFGNKGVSGKGNSKYEGNSNCRTSYSYSGETYNGVYYTTAFYENAVVGIRASDGRCMVKYNLGGYPHNMTINPSNGMLYAGHSNGFKTINLNNNQQYNCNVQYDLRVSYGTKVMDNYIYFYRNNNIYRSTLNTGGSACPQNSTSGSYYFPEGNYLGLERDPNNSNVLFTLSWSNSRLKKITVNSSSNLTTNWTKGRRSRAGSSASKLYFYYPWGLGWDENNNRLLGSNLNNGEVHVMDSNGGWVKSIGGRPKTRMQAAYEAIEAIVKDSSLTAGVNFGFAYWSAGASGFSRWIGDHTIGAGRANPCTSGNCLKVPIYKGGAAQIAGMIRTVNPGGGTHLDSAMRIASKYYTNTKYSPINKNFTCQNSYVILIGDGDWFSHTHNRGLKIVKNLFNNEKIKTFSIAFGTGISPRGYKYFQEVAKAGGTEKSIVATTGASLTAQLKAKIGEIIAEKLSFTAPAITATIEKGGSLYQAQFDYQQNKEWIGTLTRTKINPNGSIDANDVDNWSAAEEVPNPSSRKIWSVIPGTDYTVDYNNFIDTYATEIGNVMSLYENDIQDYHRKTDTSGGSSLLRRCANSAGVEDGTDDDLKGLINFVRGADYFDYDADCNLTEMRKNNKGKKIYLGDIYHSQLLVVGAPSADSEFSNINQEAYFRKVNGYDAWKDSLKSRDDNPVIYAGSNSGVLHAFDAKTGKEKWGFVPPLVAPYLPLVINNNLNRPKGGGSNAIFGVDGSIVAHDIYFKSPLGTAKKWHTILLVPYGRGGAGMSVLDVTNPDKPLHLWSIFNDSINNRVYRVDHNQVIYNYDYISKSYSLASFAEAIKVTDNYNEDDTVSSKCDTSKNTSCYKGNFWTLPVGNLTKADIKIFYNDKKYTNFSISSTTASETYILFGDEITYSADPGDTNTSSMLGLYIVTGSKATGVQTNPEYDYSELGETWSDPRIFRIPNRGAGDDNILDDVYVAAMGGGFGTQFSGIGSNLTLINLEDYNNPGSLYKRIQIEDTAASDIVNSVPSSVVLITPDTALGVNYSGGLVYVSDLEGKITKVNLTNMSDDNSGTKINIFDTTTLFNSGSTKFNGRYMYNSMDATIGDTTNELWLFAGTGDYERINDTTSGVENFMIGIKDIDYPFYKKIAKPAKADTITQCKNTTDDTTGGKCPQNADKGWYINLKDYAKVSAEPTVYRGQVYFPVYQPTKLADKCNLGEAYICGVDDECGTNNSSELDQTLGKNNKCAWVGQGVLSKIVTFGDTLFANIAGNVDCTKIKNQAKRKECEASKKTDLIGVNAGLGQVEGYRNSWRQNNY